MLRADWFWPLASQRRLVGAIAELGFALSPEREIPPSGGKPSAKKIVATYDYLNALGDLVFQVVRYDPKDFHQRRPDGRGGWIWKTERCPQIPFHLPEVLEAIAKSELVFVVEGEKDVLAAFSEGLVATCNARGANKWTDEHSEHLRGADVVLIPDNDDKGRQHTESVARSLCGRATQIRIIELPGLPIKGDLSDWLADGHTVDELLVLCDRALPWEPSDQNDTTDPQPRDDDNEPSVKAWPIMQSKAMHGIVGKIARLATARSADPNAALGGSHRTRSSHP